MATTKAERDLRRNIAVHNRLARKYEKLHGEIFNDVEQSRLRSTLERALAEVQSGGDRIKAFDLGCGSGNLTGHLLALGVEVTAADVAEGFLELVRDRYRQASLRTHRLNGRDLADLPDQSFDLVATYSVLHHIPDYLAVCAELARVCSKGGVIIIDHEASPNVWESDDELERFRRDASRFDWGKYAKPINYIHRIRRMIDPKHSNEGDIHVWPDDHIEWDAIARVMLAHGCECIFQEDYLLYRKGYRADVFDRFRDRSADSRVMMFRRYAS